MLKFVDLNLVPTKEWDDFVLAHQHGNIFQTSEFINLHKKEYNTIPFAYGAFENDKIAGILIGVIHSKYIWPIRKFTQRAIIIGGPLVRDEDETVADFLISNSTKLLKNRAIFTQFRNLWDIQHWSEIFLNNDYIFEDHLDIINDLENEKEFIIKAISKNKRANVTKSKNKGTQFEEINDETTFQTSVSLILSTYKTLGIPCPSKKYFTNAYKILAPKGLLRSFMATNGGQIIGVRLELCYKQMVYDWYAGSKKNVKSLYPNDFLPYNIIVWSKENNFNEFDFGGAGKPDVYYGVREHKMKFGGKLVNYGRFQKINHGWIMKLSTKIYTLYKILNPYLNLKK